MPPPLGSRKVQILGAPHTLASLIIVQQNRISSFIFDLGPRKIRPAGSVFFGELLDFQMGGTILSLNLNINPQEDIIDQHEFNEVYNSISSSYFFVCLIALINC